MGVAAEGRPSEEQSMRQAAVRSGLVSRPARSVAARFVVFPGYGVFGLALMVLAWVISWAQIAPLAQFYFFPIWFGYILLIDSLVLVRRGTSLLRQGAKQFIGMFLMSAAFWWAFEGLNRPVQNWHYLGTEGYSAVEYLLSASLSFSTVVPAVLETATLIASFLSPLRYLSVARSPAPLLRLRIMMGIGVAVAVAPWIWPTYAYPFLWVSGVLLIEPLNWLLGRPSVFRQLAANNVTLMFTLFAAGITCGFFWEMWNYFSMPKWYYVLPGVDAPKIFEMPIPGFLGYFPFAVELYAMYNLVLWLFGAPSRFERVLQLPRQGR